MPESLQASIQASGLGRSYNHNVGVTSEAGIPFSPAVPKAWLGQLTTRTDANTGVVTMADAGHLITNGCKVMVYWEYDAGAPTVLVTLRRRYMDVTAVAGTAVTIDLGAGSNLPTVLSNIILCKMEQVNVVVIGNDVVGLCMLASSAECNYVFESSAPAELLYVELPAGSSYVYTSAMGIANPLAGVTTATVWCGHNNTSAAETTAGTVFHN